ncbi:MAG TPA: hypothetical protein VF021_10530 [Longimicrobiales bacterium]
MVWAVIIAVIGIVAILRNRRRLDAYRPAGSRLLSDDQIRQVEERGWIELDEPLNYDDIEDEEARFWEETSWEEPDEY